MKRYVGLFAAAVLGAACSSSTTTDGTLPPNGQQPTGGDTTQTQPPPEDNGENGFALVEGLSITEIAVYQAVKVDIMKDGKAITKRNAGLVAGRDALIRVFVKPDAGFDGRKVRGELRITVDGQDKPTVFKDEKSLSKASTDASLDTTFNFTIPGDKLPEGASYNVVLIDETAQKVKSTDSPAQYPADLTPEALGLQNTGTLKIVIVPVQYNGDGSGRQPDLSQEQLDKYQEIMHLLYPAAKIEITTHAPYPWSSRISPNGSGWNSLLQSVMNLRQRDGVDDDVYYYGAFSPTATFGSFCQGGCVTGLSTVSRQLGDSYARASIGVGFPGYETAFTMAHEVGHAHGREHAPCGGAGGPDPYFPYSNGAIGTWGYDIDQKELIAPTKGTDIMGYCDNQWVSDYTYKALFDRMFGLAKGAAQSRRGAAPSTSYRVVDVAEDGTLTWGQPVTLRSAPGGQIKTARYLGASGQEVSRGEVFYYDYDHLPGGFMLVPEGMPLSATRISVQGFDKVLERNALAR
jgi:hypothetical protein